MDGRDKRKPAVLLPFHKTKRCKSDDEANKRFPAEVSMAANSSNFEKSSTPARFMFYEQGKWKDFLQDSYTTLMAAFQARHSSVEFSLHGSRYLLSFINMLQLNLLTGFCRSIAWIDVNGQSFSPLRCFEGYGFHGSIPSGVMPMPVQSLKPEDAVVVASPSLTCQQGPLDVDASEQSTGSTIVNMSKSSALAFSRPDRCDEDVSSNSLDTSSTIYSSNSMSDVTSNLYDTNSHACGHIGSWDFPLLRDKLVRLKDTETEFHEVKKRFVAGLSILANDTTVTCIRKNCHRSPSGHVRHQAFKQQEEVTKRMRGDANVRFAWYGTSKQGVSSLVLHGFGQPKTPKDGAMFGAGIYLAPEKFSNVSAVYSDVDENGERHLVLCRVIMGHMEQICRGSVQFHPSSEDYDGGVDDLCNPKQYIIWSTHMNTHILPEYIVSFKLTTPWQDAFAALRSKRKVHGKASQFECRRTGPVKMKADLNAEKSMPRCSSSPPRSPWMSIEMLFLLLKSNVSAESMDALQKHYYDLKDGKLSSSDFISNVRLIAGDHLVSSSIESMQTHVLGAVVLENLLASGRYQMADNNRVA